MILSFVHRLLARPLVIGAVALLASCASDPLAAAGSPSISRPAEPLQPAQQAPVPVKDPALEPVAPAAGRQHSQQSLANQPAAKHAVAQAKADLAQRLGITPDEIEVLSVQRHYKPSNQSDTPGRADGWTVRLGAHDSTYVYQIRAAGKAHLVNNPAQ